MTRITGPDCAVMYNLINTLTHTHTYKNIYINQSINKSIRILWLLFQRDVADADAPVLFPKVVRDRAKRAAMKGHECQECAAYVAAVGGSPGEREALLNMCSRRVIVRPFGLCLCLCPFLCFF